jgi:hypothetical protein
MSLVSPVMSTEPFIVIVMTVKDTRVPLTITLGVLGLCVIATIVAGYFHGHMDLPKVLHNAFK